MIVIYVASAVEVPRRVVRGYLEALERAGVRPKAVVIAAVALGDYAAFCRGRSDGSLAIMTPSGGDLELAVFVERQLIADHVLRETTAPSLAEVDELIRRDLAEVFQGVEGPIELLHAGVAAVLPEAANGSSDLFALADGVTIRRLAEPDLDVRPLMDQAVLAARALLA